MRPMRVFLLTLGGIAVLEAAVILSETDLWSQP